MTAHSLSVERLHCRFGARAVVSDLSFQIAPGEVLALVGESGSGKSTAARAIAGLHPLASGRLRLDGIDITQPVHRRPPEARRRIQLIFQNPDSSLNPRHDVATLIGRPLKVFFGTSAAERAEAAGALLRTVRLPQDFATRLPSALSGGERQRVAIARALAARPSLLLCDEITSALDVSVQASILDLLRDLQRTTKMSLMFITHDLAVARWLADRVAVLRDGRLCEIGPAASIFSRPTHPYTKLLLAAARQGAGTPSATPAALMPSDA